MVKNQCCFAEDGGPHGWYHAKKCPVAKKLRDSWRTPGWLCRGLGRFSLDPCSNHLSEVEAEQHCVLEDGQDGLAVSWEGEDVYINGPFSYLLPWAQKAHTAKSAVALVNVDSSTAWWKAFLASGLIYRFDFGKRIAFEPPPHIKPSTNSKAQCLLVTASAAPRLRERLASHKIDGTWWRVDS